MDLTNYAEQMGKVERQRANAVLRWSAIQIARIPVNLLHRISRTRFSGVKQRLDERLKGVRARLATLGREIRDLESRGAAVERDEGLLATCVTCKEVFRTKFGGAFTQNDLAFLGSDFPRLAGRWLCGRCFAGVQTRLHRAAWAFANFVGVVRSCSIGGFQIVEEMEWLAADDEYESIQEVKDNLRLKAARLGANACTQFHYEIIEDTVVQGHRGAYPQVARLVRYAGTAFAVVLDRVG